MRDPRYMREGRGVCKVCAREIDMVVPHLPMPGGAGPMTVGMEPVRWSPRGIVTSRHLRRIEEYGPQGASPTGFCSGSLAEGNPVRTPEREGGHEGRGHGKRRT